jgi:hypothetical protein
MPRPPHSPWLDLPNDIWRWVQIMKFLTVQLPPFSRHLIPLRSKYSSQNPVLKHPQYSLSVRDQVSHPYKTTGRIIGHKQTNKGNWKSGLQVQRGLSMYLRFNNIAVRFLLFLSMGWDYVSELRPSLAYCSFPDDIRLWKSTVEWHWQGETDGFGEKLYQRHFVHHRSQFEHEPGAPL